MVLHTRLVISYFHIVYQHSLMLVVIETIELALVAARHASEAVSVYCTCTIQRKRRSWRCGRWKLQHIFGAQFVRKKQSRTSQVFRHQNWWVFRAKPGRCNSRWTVLYVLCNASDSSSRGRRRDKTIGSERKNSDQLHNQCSD